MLFYHALIRFAVVGRLFTCEVVGQIGFLVRAEITDLTKPQIKPSVIGTCAQSSSKDQNEKSHNSQKSSSAVHWYRKGGFCYER